MWHSICGRQKQSHGLALGLQDDFLALVGKKCGLLSPPPVFMGI